MPESLLSLFPQRSWPSPFVSVALGGRGRLLLRPPQVLRHPCLLDVLSMSSCALFSCLGGRMQPLPTSFQGVESDTWQSYAIILQCWFQTHAWLCNLCCLMLLPYSVCGPSPSCLFPHHWKMTTLPCVISDSDCCSAHLLPFHTGSVTFCFHDISSSLLLSS